MGSPETELETRFDYEWFILETIPESPDRGGEVVWGEKEASAGLILWESPLWQLDLGVLGDSVPTQRDRRHGYWLEVSHPGVSCCSTKAERHRCLQRGSVCVPGSSHCREGVGATQTASVMKREDGKGRGCGVRPLSLLGRRGGFREGMAFETPRIPKREQ